MNTDKKLRSLVTAAIFAAAITMVTAYVLHIPIPGGSGYVHLGDALIYLAAALLPAPYAIAAASIGAGLADLLTFPSWTIPTLLIKAVVAMQFSSKGSRILTKRNTIAVFTTLIVSPGLYTLALYIMSGSTASLVPQFVGTLVQGIGSAVVFLPVALALDGMKFKSKVPHLA